VTTPTPSRPLPAVDSATAPFWEAAREHRLVIQRCNACRAYRFPPELGCPECGSDDSTWTEVSGKAKLYSWTVVHPPVLPYFQSKVPWPVAAVELAEGPRMVTNVLDLPIEDYCFDLPLQVAFEDIPGEDVTLVVFRPAQ
jgi:hypothetical protein